MRESRFANEQIELALRQAEAGTPLAEVGTGSGLARARSIAGRCALEASVCRNCASCAAMGGQRAPERVGGRSHPGQGDSPGDDPQKSGEACTATGLCDLGPGSLSCLGAAGVPGSLGPRDTAMRYRSVRPGQGPLRARLPELTLVRRGYRQLHVLLRREGWRVNLKRLYRLCAEDGLTLKRRPA